MTLADRVEINPAGWLWPKGDRYTWSTVKEELAEIPVLLDLCPERRVCVQAGGNGGLWVDALATEFETVYTFEVCPINFRCLVHNVSRENVVFTQAALTDRTGEFIAIDRWCGEANPGANRIAQGQGIVPTFALDDRKLPVLDLLQLDIEGAELLALKGAEQTIARCKPVICVELRNHAHHYGATDDAIRAWILARGYRFVQRMNCDEFFVPA